MDKRKYVVFAACRSGQDFADRVYKILIEDQEVNRSLLRLNLENIDFADSKLRPKATRAHKGLDGRKKDLSDALLNSHVLLFQQIQNPFAKEPERYLAEELMGYMAEEERSVDQINNFLMDHLEMVQHESGHYRGFIKSYFVEDGERRIKSFVLERCEEIFKIKKYLGELKNWDSVIEREKFFQAALETYLRRIIQPRYTPSEFDEFFGTVHNLRSRGVSTIITGVWPFSDGRSDRFARGENNETRYLASKAAHFGLEYLLTIRMHSKDKQEELWRNAGIKVYNASAVKEFAKYIVDNYEDEIRAGKFVLSSLDEGGEVGVIELTKEVRKLVKEKNITDRLVPYTIMKKTRAREHVVSEVEILKGYGKDNPSLLRDKTVCGYDDMIDTAGSTLEWSNLVVHELGAKSFIMIVEHPVFSYPATRNLQKAYDSGSLLEVATLNTVEHPTNYGWHKVISAEPIMARAIKGLFFPKEKIEVLPNPTD